MLHMSRPVQLLLLCTAAFAAAWFTVLRPKPFEAPPAAQTQAAPGQTGAAAGTGNATTGLGKAVDKAQTGANTAGQDGARAAGTDPGATTSTPAGSTPGPTTSTPAPTGSAPGAPPGKPKTSTKDLPASVATALDKNKVVLLLFYSPTSADDAAVRGELRQVKRRNGKVFVTSAPISQLARYAAITRGVEILQSPTIIVVGPTQKASTITGYTDATEIDQVVSDAIASGKKN